MRLQIHHSCSHVLNRFRFGSEDSVKLLEIGHFRLLEFEDELIRESLGKTVNVVLGCLKAFHRECDRVVGEVGQFPNQYSPLFLDARVFEDVAKDAALVIHFIALLFQLLQLVLVSKLVATASELLAILSGHRGLGHV